MDPRLQEVLWSINARLEEIVEAIKQLRLGPTCKVEPGTVLCDCGAIGLPHEHVNKPHEHVWLECGHVGWNRNLIVCEECGAMPAYDPRYTFENEFHGGQLDDEWGGCPGCKYQHTDVCGGCK